VTRYLIRAKVQVVPGQLTRNNSDSYRLLADEHTVELIQESSAGVLWAMELASERLTEFVIVSGMEITEVPEAPAMFPGPSIFVPRHDTATCRVNMCPHSDHQPQKPVGL
jgi:hypothetical protein